MGRNFYTQVGVIRGDDQFIIRGVNGRDVVNTNLNSIEESYKSTFRDY